MRRHSKIFPILAIGFGLGFVDACAAPVAATAGPAQTAQSAKGRAMPMEVIVNGAKGGTWLLLDQQGVLYARRDAFEEWRVQVGANAPTVEFRWINYVPLSAI